MEAVICFLSPAAAGSYAFYAGSTSGGALYGVLYFIFMSVVILAAAYFVTKFIAKKGVGMSGNKNLKIVESLSLGIDKSLLLVKVGGQYLLLGSCQKNLSLITEIEPEKLFQEDAGLAGEPGEESFESYMDKLLAKNNNGESGSTVKNSLYRLKSMVRGSKTDV